MALLTQVLTRTLLAGACIGAVGCDCGWVATEYPSHSATHALWENAGSNERVFISTTDITPAELERRGVKYERYRSDLLDGYLVEKSKFDRFRDYTFRVLATPFTVTLDTAVVVTVVGVGMLAEAGMNAASR